MAFTDIIVVFSLIFIISLAVLGFFSIRLSGRKDKIIVGLVVLVAVVAGISVYGGIMYKMVQHPVGHVRTWNLFHHYLGAKYFPELGYENLYSCALAADAELQGVWDKETLVRNLNTYALGSRQNNPPCSKNRFTDRNWAWFRSDLLQIQRTSYPDADYPRAGDRSPQIWNSILTDKGFNPSPVWATLSWWLTNQIRLDSGWGLKFLLTLDIILLIIALGFVGWVFGWDTAALVLLFVVTFWGPYQRLAGNVIQYGWLFAVLMGFCFWKISWKKTSAAFFAFAIMARLFPVFFLAGLFVRLVQGVIRRDSNTTRPLFTFFAWIILFCSVFFLGSLLLPNGLTAWLEFSENIQRHGAVLHQEMFNVGLKNLISTCCSLVNTPATFEYAQHLTDRYGLYILLAGALLALFITCALRRENSNLSLMSMGYIPMFALVTVSRYYYIGLAVMMLPQQNRRFVTIGLLGTNLIMYIMRQFLFTRDDTLFYSYWIVQIIYLLFFCGSPCSVGCLEAFRCRF